MAQNRLLLLLLVAPVLVASLGDKAAAPEPAVAVSNVHNGVQNALGVLKADMWNLITIEKYQWAVAIFALVIGLIALFDGRQFFSLFVLSIITGVLFVFMMSQLNDDWFDEAAAFTKPVGSMMFALFVGFAAYKGWEGTQLLLGLAFGMYMYSIVLSFAMATPFLKTYADKSLAHYILGAVLVMAGTWMVHEKYGAGRVLGFLCPIFGSSLLVSTLSYFALLACALPAVADKVDLKVSPSQVPSVFEFWYMIVNPMQSKAVGYFTDTNKEVVVGGNSLPMDKVSGIFFWVVFSLLGIYFQLKSDRKRKVRAANDLNTRLLEKTAQKKTSNNKV